MKVKDRRHNRGTSRQGQHSPVGQSWDSRLPTGGTWLCKWSAWTLVLTLGAMVLGSSPSGQALAAGGHDEVRFDLYLGYTIVAKGSIGGLQKLNFIVDTGAVPSVVDTRVARKLGLKGVVGTVSVFSKEVTTEEVMVPSFKLGPVEAKSVRCLVQDLRFIKNGLGVRIDALIGLDVLGGQGFSIDYELKRIAFGAPTGEPNRPKALGIDVPFEIRPGFVVMQIQVQGHPLRLMVDTGTSDLILFAPRVQDWLPAASTVGSKVKTSLGGTERLPALELAGASLGPTELPGLRAALISGAAPALVNIDGLLAVTALGVKRVTFDFERGILHWELRSASHLRVR